MRRALHYGVQAQLFIFQATSGCCIIVPTLHNLQKTKKQFKSKDPTIRRTPPSTPCLGLFKEWASPTSPPSYPPSRSSLEFGRRFERNMQNFDEHMFYCRRQPGCFLATRSVKSVSSSLFPSSVRFTEGPSGPRWR